MWSPMCSAASCLPRDIVFQGVDFVIRGFFKCDLSWRSWLIRGSNSVTNSLCFLSEEERDICPKNMLCKPWDSAMTAFSFSTGHVPRAFLVVLNLSAGSTRLVIVVFTFTVLHWKCRNMKVALAQSVATRVVSSAVCWNDFLKFCFYFWKQLHGGLSFESFLFFVVVFCRVCMN